VLNDASKRKQYDVYGPEEDRRSNRSDGYSHGFEGMFYNTSLSESYMICCFKKKTVNED